MATSVTADDHCGSLIAVSSPQLASAENRTPCTPARQARGRDLTLPTPHRDRVLLVLCLSPHLCLSPGNKAEGDRFCHPLHRGGKR